MLDVFRTTFINLKPRSRRKRELVAAFEQGQPKRELRSDKDRPTRLRLVPSGSDLRLREVRAGHRLDGPRADLQSNQLWVRRLNLFRIADHQDLARDRPEVDMTPAPARQNSDSFHQPFFGQLPNPIGEATFRFEKQLLSLDPRIDRHHQSSLCGQNKRFAMIQKNLATRELNSHPRVDYIIFTRERTLMARIPLMNLIVSTTFFGLCVPLAQAQSIQPSDVPPPGKEIIQKIVRRYKEIGAMRVSLWNGAQSIESGPFYTEGQIDVAWDGKGKFRIAQMDMWGDGMMWVSDGKALLIDYLDWSEELESAPIGTRNPLLSGPLRAGADSGSMLFAFLVSEGAVQGELVKESTIKVLGTRQKIEGLEVQTSRLGPVVIRLRPNDFLIAAFEYRSFPSFEMRMDGMETQPNARSLQEVTYLQLGGRLDPSLFIVPAPPKPEDSEPPS